MRRALGRVPPVVWASTAAFVALLACWSVLVPLYEAPDEPAHVDLIMHTAAGGTYPRYDERRWSAGVVADCAPYIASTRWCPLDVSRPFGEREPPVRHAAADAPSKATGGTFDDLGGDVEVWRGNQLAQHPPLYYTSTGLFLRAVRLLVPGEWPMAREVALLRGVNVALMAPLPLLAWWTARRLGVGRRSASVAALLPLVIPQLAHIGSTVNNDNLLTLLGAVAAVLVAGVSRGDRSRRTAVALGLTCAAAMLTKSSAVVYLGVVPLAYVIGWWRSSSADRPRAGQALLRLATVAGLVVLGAAWWYVRNRREFGSFVPSIDTETILGRGAPPGFEPDAGEWTGTFFEAVPARFWGWFGWFSVRQSFRFTVVSSIVTALLMAVGLVWPRHAGGADRASTSGRGTEPAATTVRRRHLIVLAAPGVGLLLVVIVRAWSLYEGSGRSPFLQGRYLFPAVTAAAVVVACGAHRVAGRWAAPLVALWAALMHWDALRSVLAGYWAAPDSSAREQVRAAVAWSRWPGELLLIGALIGAASLVGLTVAIVGDVRDAGAAGRREPAVA